MFLGSISIASTALFAALALQLSVTISLPYISSVYIVATSFTGNVSCGNYQPLSQIRMGIWAACFYTSTNSTCLSAKAGYNVTVTEGKTQVDIGSSWTSGLPLQIIAIGFTTIALPLTHFYFYKDNTATDTTICTVGVAGVASILTVLIEVALYFYVSNRMQTLEPDIGNTNLGPAMWLGLVSSALLAAAFARLYSTKHYCQEANVPDPQDNQPEKIAADFPQQSDFNSNAYGVPRPGAVQPFTAPYPTYPPHPYPPQQQHYPPQPYPPQVPQPYTPTYQPQGHQGSLYQGPPQGPQGPPQAHSGQPQAYRQVGEFDPPPYNNSA